MYKFILLEGAKPTVSTPLAEVTCFLLYPASRPVFSSGLKALKYGVRKIFYPLAHARFTGRCWALLGAGGSLQLPLKFGVNISQECLPFCGDLASLRIYETPEDDQVHWCNYQTEASRYLIVSLASLPVSLLLCLSLCDSSGKKSG